MVDWKTDELIDWLSDLLDWLSGYNYTTGLLMEWLIDWLTG